VWTLSRLPRFPLACALAALIACSGEGPAVDPDPLPVDRDNDGFTDDVDCDDADPSVYPGAPEICDGKDNNCNELIDDEDPAVVDRPTWYPDADGDDFGDPELPVAACAPPPNMILDGTDCDDTDDAVYPGAPEVCDGRDNSCNGKVDDEDPDVIGQPEWFADTDGDGLGDPDASVLACEQPDGYVDNFLDCDDRDRDAGAATPWYRDADGDRFGDPDAVRFACEPPDGYVADDRDCDDTAFAVNPNATEICDRIDNDCDGKIDDDDPKVVGRGSWFPDDDGDGFGDEGAAPTLACVAPRGFVDDATDCDDTTRLVHPGRFDFGDGRDNDCDDEVDEDVGAETWRHDRDIQSIWTGNCASCHISSTSGGLSLSSSAWTKIVSKGSSVGGLDYVTPGDPQGSYLWHKLAGTHTDVGGSGGRMPSSSGLGTSTLDKVELWILEGAVR
jgi:hypothetical protein